MGLYACQGEQATAERLAFEVVDSLLSPVDTAKAAGICLRPPLGFISVPDSMLGLIQSRLSAAVGGREGVTLARAYIDPRRSSGIMLSTIRGLRLDGDTSAFVNKYRQSLIAAYGQDHVQVGDYRVNTVYVKNYLVMDTLAVRFQLIGFPPAGDAVELLYVAPRIIYPELVKSFESSIGTIKPVAKGG